MEESAKPTSRRQIARLIGGSTLPMYVLSEDDTVVYVNEAAEAYFDAGSDKFIGLSCNFVETSDPSYPKDKRSLSERLASPIQWDRSHILIAAEPNGTHVRYYIPLDRGPASKESTILVIVSEESKADAERRFDPIGLFLRERVSTLDGDLDHQVSSPWFLAGSSAFAKQIRRQTQIAIRNHCPTLIVGMTGEPREALATYIHRIRKEKRDVKNASLISIDCQLMDDSLLQSMFELIDETRGTHGKDVAVMLSGLDELPESSFGPLASFLSSRSELELFATAQKPSVAIDQTPRSRVWLQVSSFVVPLRPIRDRKEDLSELLEAWYRQRQIGLSNQLRDESSRVSSHFSCASAFRDAIDAYPWIGDFAELDKALNHAFQEAAGQELQAAHLPIAIRTSVSQLEETIVVSPLNLDEILEDTERKLILEALECSKGNRSAAAKLLHISRARLLRRLQQWGIDSEGTETNDDDLPKFEEIE